MTEFDVPWLQPETLPATRETLIESPFQVTSFDTGAPADVPVVPEGHDVDVIGAPQRAARSMPEAPTPAVQPRLYLRIENIPAMAVEFSGVTMHFTAPRGGRPVTSLPAIGYDANPPTTAETLDEAHRSQREAQDVLGIPAPDLVLAEDNSTPAGPPLTAVKMDESQLKEWVHKALEGAHVIGSVAEITELFHASTAWPAIEAGLSLGSAAVTGGAAGVGVGILSLLGEIAGPIGYAATFLIAALEVYHAFSTGTRIHTKKGYCYGIMWDALKMAVPNKTFQDWGGDSGEELTKAWNEGVAAGRKAFGTDIKLHNQVLVRIAYERMRQQARPNKFFTYPEGRVLNMIWEQVRGDDLTDHHLTWLTGMAVDLVGTDYNQKMDDYEKRMVDGN